MPSRTEELRAKLRGKPVDRELIALWSRLNDVLEREKSASVDNKRYVEALLSRMRSDQPIDLDAWLAARIKDSFLCDRLRPVWPVEPSWCFFRDRPMTFLAQFTDASGVMFFVFTCIDDIDGAKRSVYRMLAFQGGDRINLDGHIV